MDSFTIEENSNDEISLSHSLGSEITDTSSSSDLMAENELFFNHDILIEEWNFLSQTIKEIQGIYTTFIDKTNTDDLSTDDEKESIAIFKNFLQYKINIFNKILLFIAEHRDYLENKKNASTHKYNNTIYILQSYMRLIIETLNISKIETLHHHFPLRTALYNDDTGDMSDDVWKLCVVIEDDMDNDDRFIAKIISIQGIEGVCIIDHDISIRKSKKTITEKDLKIHKKNLRTYFSPHLKNIHMWVSNFQKLYYQTKLNKDNAIIVDGESIQDNFSINNLSIDCITYQLHGFFDKLEKENKIGGFSRKQEDGKEEHIDMHKRTQNLCLLDYINNEILTETYQKKLNKDKTGLLPKIMSTKYLILSLQTNYSVLKTDKNNFIDKIQEFAKKIREINKKETAISDKAMADNEQLNQLLEKMILHEKGYDPQRVMQILSSGELTETINSLPSSSS